MLKFVFCVTSKTFHHCLINPNNLFQSPLYNFHPYIIFSHLLSKFKNIYAWIIQTLPTIALETKTYSFHSIHNHPYCKMFLGPCLLWYLLPQRAVLLCYAKYSGKYELCCGVVLISYTGVLVLHVNHTTANLFLAFLTFQLRIWNIPNIKDRLGPGVVLVWHWGPWPAIWLHVGSCTV